MDAAKAPSDVRAGKIEDMMRRYGTSMLRMCYLYLRDRTLAEDAMQDAFLKAYQSLDGFQGLREQSEKAWLMRIAVNTCKDYHRSAWFRHRDKQVLPEELADPMRQQDFESGLLADAVMRLPAKLKEVVLLHYYQNLSYDEITVALDISKSTVYERLKKAKGYLRGTLERGGEP